MCGTLSWLPVGFLAYVKHFYPVDVSHIVRDRVATLLLWRIACRVQRCSLLLPTFRGLSLPLFVCGCGCCLCVCPVDITMSCAKTAEPVEMPFALQALHMHLRHITT